MGPGCFTGPQLEFPQSQFDFYRRLEPLDGAISAVESLIASSEYDPYILTAPSIHNPMSYTEKRVWIEEKFGFHFVEKLIICSNKGLHKGRYLIDDNLDRLDIIRRDEGPGLLSAIPRYEDLNYLLYKEYILFFILL